MDRIYSGKHLNDQSVYHSDDGPNCGESGIENDQKPDTVQEVRNGIANERDLDLEKADAAQPDLEKSRTAKSNQSRHDPKLVGCSRFPNLYWVLNCIGKMGRS